MSVTGAYGINIPSNITANDIEIYYSYRPTLSSTDDASLKFKKLDSSILVPAERTMLNNEPDKVLEGMYNLHLPLGEFSKKGFYTVYIKPKEIRAVVADVGVLSSFNDVRGLVIDSTKVSEENKFLFSSNNALIGYRLVYLNPSNGTREGYYRIVTSNNRCEPLTQSVTNSNEKIVSYRYNDSSTLTFITVTPSTAPSFKSSASPFIGNVSQEVLFINTKFEPVALEIEMVDHDADTISNMLEGSQLRDLEGGLVTTFNENDEIYHQSQHYTLKDNYTSRPIYEVKKNMGNDIDFSQTISDKG